MTTQKATATSGPGYSPAPWRWLPDALQVMGYDGNVVCVLGVRTTEEQDAANGPLIAAAPAMLAALEEADRWLNDPGAGFKSYLTDNIKRIIEAATGSQP